MPAPASQPLASSIPHWHRAAPRTPPPHPSPEAPGTERPPCPNQSRPETRDARRGTRARRRSSLLTRACVTYARTHAARQTADGRQTGRQRVEGQTGGKRRAREKVEAVPPRAAAYLYPRASSLHLHAPRVRPTPPPLRPRCPRLRLRRTQAPIDPRFSTSSPASTCLPTAFRLHPRFLNPARVRRLRLSIHGCMTAQKGLRSSPAFPAHLT